LNFEVPDPNVPVTSLILQTPKLGVGWEKRTQNVPNRDKTVTFVS